MESMEHRHEKVIIETLRHRIEGTLTLSRDGYRSRVSDILNATERDFLSLTDATVVPLDGHGDDVVHPFVVVSRRQIVVAIPLNPAAETEPSPFQPT